MRNNVYVNGVEGVVTGGTSTVNVPLDRRYHALKIYATATGSPTAPDVVSRVRLYVNGVLQRDMTPAQLISIAALHGITAATGEIPIYFSEPWLRTPTGEEALSWDLSTQLNTSKCTLEVQLQSGLTSPALQVQGSFDYGRNVSDGKPFLQIVKILQQTYSAPLGTYDIVNIPTSFPLYGLLFTPSTGTISSMEVYNASEKVREGTKVQNDRWLADYNMVGTAWGWALLFNNENQASSVLVVQNQGDLLVRPVLSASNGLNVVIMSRAPGYL